MMLFFLSIGIKIYFDSVSLFDKATAINGTYLFNSSHGIKQYGERINDLSKNIQFQKKSSPKPYVNPTLGYKLEYPSSWTEKNISPQYTLFSSSESGKNISISIYQEMTYPHITLSGLTSLYYEVANSTGGRVFRAEEININSIKGFILDAFYPKEGKISVHILFIHNSIPIAMEFNIYYFFNLKDLQTLLEFSNLSMNSLEFTNNYSTQIATDGIRTGNNPTSFALDPNSNITYISNYLSNTVSLLDLRKNKILDNLTVGSRPNDIAISNSDDQIYVTNVGTNTVSVIDGISKQIINTLQVGDLPTHLVIDPYFMDRMIFVANTNSKSIDLLHN